MNGSVRERKKTPSTTPEENELLQSWESFLERADIAAELSQ